MASGSPAKRARTRLVDSPPALSGSSPLHLDRRDWAHLTSGPAGQIAERALANDVADYIRFRAVCTAWRACCADPRAHGVGDRRFHPRQWIMLPRVSSNFQSWRRRFLNTFTGERILVPIPDHRSYYTFGTTAEGLLVVCHNGTDVVQLLNPLTGQLADYPRATTMLDPSRGGGVRCLWSRSAGLAGDSTLAILCGILTLAVAKPGDDRWTQLSLGDRILSTLPFAGRLYCVTRDIILAVETTAANQRPRLVAVATDHEQQKGILNWMYPVYDDGGLILVHRYLTGDDYYSEKHMAYRAKLGTGNLVPMRGLGGHALFVGPARSQSVFVSTRVSGSISADTVYVCRNDMKTLRPKVVAFDLLGGCSEANFGEGDIAHYLSSYVCSSII